MDYGKPPVLSGILELDLLHNDKIRIKYSLFSSSTVTKLFLIFPTCEPHFASRALVLDGGHGTWLVSRWSPCERRPCASPGWDSVLYPDEVVALTERCNSPNWGGDSG